MGPRAPLQSQSGAGSVPICRRGEARQQEIAAPMSRMMARSLFSCRPNMLSTGVETAERFYVRCMARRHPPKGGNVSVQAVWWRWSSSREQPALAYLICRRQALSLAFTAVISLRLDPYDFESGLKPSSRRDMNSHVVGDSDHEMKTPTKAGH